MLTCTAVPFHSHSFATSLGSAEGDGAAGVALRLLGVGVSKELTLEPLVLLAPGGAALGVDLACSFTITNPNASERTWQWLPEQVCIYIYTYIYIFMYIYIFICI